ncbi:galactoside 2-alpha-L-fucosyltransferase-like [Typha latifolia]|uniref:galactoside 2-alpha-L-fucosyltransferase-like n=1 Tax=Typha latifolia TaxID=4733 RepID=UPI003C2E3AB9
MDAKRVRRQGEADQDPEMEKGERWRGVEVALVGLLITLPLLVFLFGGHWSTSAFFSRGAPLPASTKGSRNVSSSSSSAAASLPTIPTPKNILGGLLSPAFDERSCLSRYKSALYRRASPFAPSSYLVERLRKYEALHKKCGPNSRRYREAVEQLNSGHNSHDSQCQYVIWFPCNGLGNRMLSLAATFLYALLTNRVLLTYVPKEQANLFCEPFPGSSWVLPPYFPIQNFYRFNRDSPQSYANMLKNKVISNNVNVSAESLPAYVYFHLEQFRLRLDNNIFCEDDQLILAKFNWMILKSDSYFVPPLFLMPMYEDELRRLFPAKESVFHHLGRYLFHPSNSVWGIITRYYESYLTKADERLGLQIRIFPEKPISFDDMYDQLFKCLMKEELLPTTTTTESSSNSSSTIKRLKSVLVTSLYSGYYEKIKSMYYENPTSTGEIVAIYQPSHEEWQHSEAQTHNQKALAEMFLLSYNDKVVISAWSTFGYVAHGLAGLKPWILLRPSWNQKTADPPCLRAMSVEPCLHSPPSLDCKAKRDVDPGALVPHVRHCEDVGQGLKLVD